MLDVWCETPDDLFHWGRFSAQNVFVGIWMSLPDIELRIGSNPVVVVRVHETPFDNLAALLEQAVQQGNSAGADAGQVVISWETHLGRKEALANLGNFLQVT